MIALAQGSAGLALVMCFALLRTRQVGGAALLLAVQSAAVAATAVVLHRPLMAVPPLVLGGGIWLIRHQTPILESQAAVIGGAKLSIGAGAVLAILCQSQGGITLPSAIVLLSVLLAATRTHPLMQVVALVGAQNGIALTGCLIAQPALLPAALLLPAACLVLPLPLAASLLVPAMAPWPINRTMGVVRAWMPQIPRGRWLGWLDLGLALAMFAATLIIRPEGLALVFAPLLGLDAIMRSCARQQRDIVRLRGSAKRRDSKTATSSNTVVLGQLVNDNDAGYHSIGAGAYTDADTGKALADGPPSAMPGSTNQATGAAVSSRALGPAGRAAGLAQSGFMILAVCTSDLVLAWVAVLAAIAMALLPTVLRRWGSAVLAFLAAGLALFGMLLSPDVQPILGYFSLFVGFATIAAVVPDLAVVLVILILRRTAETSWPPDVEALGTSIAVVALMACAALLTGNVRSHRATLLLLGQASVAALAICIGQPDGRFAALVLLILVILTRAAARITDGPAAALAIAGLAGLSPMGVFPGLILVALAMSGREPWLLLPFSAALIPIALAGVPRRPPEFALRREIPSIAWLPLLLAVAVGYFAPNEVVQWLRILTAGNP